MSNLVPFNEMSQMAEAIAKSGLFGMNTPSQALALMVVAQAEGRHPGIIARDYHIIKNRPSLKADAMLSRFLEAGGTVKWLDYTDTKASATFSHPQGGTITLSWTLEDAKRAELNTTRDNWKKYPRAMLRARLVSEGIRTIYPGVICGTYTPEEIEDMQPAKVEKDITPTTVAINHDQPVNRNELPRATIEQIETIEFGLSTLVIASEKRQELLDKEGAANFSEISAPYAEQIIRSLTKKLDDLINLKAGIDEMEDQLQHQNRDEETENGH